MKGKERVILLCLCVGIFGLTGCAENKNLTEEQQDIIAEYSAGILLRYDDSYSQRLEAEEPIPEETSGEQPAPATPTPTPETQTGESGGTEEVVTENEVPLEKLYGVDGFKVTYKSYKICREYPKKADMYMITAPEGYRLFVVRCQVKNTTTKTLKVNLMKRKIGYPLTIDGEEYAPTIAIQKNGGLNNLKTTLKANASEEAILVYNVPDTLKKLSSAAVKVKDGDRVSTIQIKG